MRADSSLAIRSFVGNASSRERLHKIIDVTKKTQPLEPLTWNNTPDPVGVRFITIVFGGFYSFASNYARHQRDPQSGNWNRALYRLSRLPVATADAGLGYHASGNPVCLPTNTVLHIV